jgi:hypothetical protein
LSSQNEAFTNSTATRTFDPRKYVSPKYTEFMDADATGVKPMIVCVHEDRPEYLIGLKLTVLSLTRHCPDLPVIISCPHPPDTFRQWVATLSNAQLMADPNLAGLSWNVKPTILLKCLNEGHRDVIWIDTDILVNQDFRPRLGHLDDKTLVVTQEVYWGQQQGGNHRTLAWGLKPERILPTTVNTGVVRVTPQHIELLHAWQTLLNHPAYRQAQLQPYYERPLHMLTDQEVLTALLGSTEFSDIPIKMLERGVDIAQCFGPAGYTPTERLHNLRRGLPAFIHSMGRKPWERAPSPKQVWSSKEPLLRRLRKYYDYIHLELSPYTALAREYQEQVGEEATWMEMKSTPARLLATLSAGHPTLQGFPLALFDAGVRYTRRLIGMGRYRFDSSFNLESSPLSQT